MLIKNTGPRRRPGLPRCSEGTLPPPDQFRRGRQAAPPPEIDPGPAICYHLPR